FQKYPAVQGLATPAPGRFNFTFAYTWSKALGILSGGLQPQGNAAVSEYQFDQRQTIYGVLSTDRTHIATATYSWLLPDIESNKALDAVFGGWQIAGISTYISGGP